MSPELHAKHILKAWQHLDFETLEAELNRAHLAYQQAVPCSLFQCERAEILSVAIAPLQTLFDCDINPSPHRLEASLSLLRNLCDSPTTDDAARSVPVTS